MSKEKDQLVKLLSDLIAKANYNYDGHVTIMKFTTGYKVVFQTPPSLDEDDREVLQRIPSGMNLYEALEYANSKYPSFY